MASLLDLFQRFIYKGNRTETTAKVAAVCAGIISTGFFFKVIIIPCILHIVLSTLPGLWISVRGWLSPPFMYIILNFIIITIAATSTFQRCNLNDHDKPVSKLTQTNLKIQTSNINIHLQDIWKEMIEEQIYKPLDSSLYFQKSSNQSEESPPTSDYTSQKHDQENKSTKEEEEKEDESEVTMDETWRVIMEAQGKVVARRLNKCETSPPQLAKKDSDAADEVSDSAAWARKEMKKSETFNDRMSLTREKSMSPEELNRRAEAFINNFNN